MFYLDALFCRNCDSAWNSDRREERRKERKKRNIPFTRGFIRHVFGKEFEQSQNTSAVYFALVIMWRPRNRLSVKLFSVRWGLPTVQISSNEFICPPKVLRVCVPPAQGFRLCVPPDQIRNFRFSVSPVIATYYVGEKDSSCQDPC